MEKILIKKIKKDFFDIHIEKTYWVGGESYGVGAYSKNGEYIGDPSEIFYVFNKFGVCEDLSSSRENGVICVGYSPKDKKYYGWSHRAIFGFGVGSKVKRGDTAYLPDTFEELRDGDKADNRRIEKCHLLREDGMCGATDDCKFINDPEDSDRLIPDPDYIPDIKLCSPEVCVLTLGRGEWEAKTLEDAKQMALDFAQNVS